MSYYNYYEHTTVLGRIWRMRARGTTLRMHARSTTWVCRANLHLGLVTFSDFPEEGFRIAVFGAGVLELAVGGCHKDSPSCKIPK